MFKVLCSDMDGVLCAGKTYTFDKNGDVLTVSKTFCDLDWTAAKLFKAHDIKVCIMSSDKANETIAKDRNIDFFHSRNERGMIIKGEVIEDIAKHYGVFLSEIAYVGDDIFDLTALGRVGYAYCPKTAGLQLTKHRFVKIIDRRAGEGVLDSLYEQVFGRPSPDIISKMYLIDQMENKK